MTTIYLSDDFEAFPAGWTTHTAGGGTITKSNTHVHGGLWACKIDSHLGGSSAYMEVYFTRFSGRHHLHLWVYINSALFGTSRIFLGQIYGGDYTIACWIAYHAGAFYLQDGAYNQYVGVLSADTWHQIDVYYDYYNAQIAYYIDGMLQSGTYTSSGGAGVDPLDLEYVGFGNGLIYIDDLVIDNATSLEIQYSGTASPNMPTNGTSVALGLGARVRSLHRTATLAPTIIG